MSLISFHSHINPDSLNRVLFSLYSFCREDFIEGVDRDCFYSLGIHPWWIRDCKQDLDFLWSFIQMHAQDKRCMAIGETGLDRIRDKDTILAQNDWCLRHLILANNLNKPLIVHLVRSSSDWLSLIKVHPSKIPHVIHDTHLGIKEMESILRLHPQTYFSFSPRIMKATNFETKKEYLKSIESQLLLEVDDFNWDDLTDLYGYFSDYLGISEQALLEDQQNKVRAIFKI